MIYYLLRLTRALAPYSVRRLKSFDHRSVTRAAGGEGDVNTWPLDTTRAVCAQQGWWRCKWMGATHCRRIAKPRVWTHAPQPAASGRYAIAIDRLVALSIVPAVRGYHRRDEVKRCQENSICQASATPSSGCMSTLSRANSNKGGRRNARRRSPLVPCTNTMARSGTRRGSSLNARGHYRRAVPRFLANFMSSDARLLLKHAAHDFDLSACHAGDRTSTVIEAENAKHIADATIDVLVEKTRVELINAVKSPGSDASEIPIDGIKVMDVVQGVQRVDTVCRGGDAN
jgi:hypothetical protein